MVQSTACKLAAVATEAHWMSISLGLRNDETVQGLCIKGPTTITGLMNGPSPFIAVDY